MDLEKLMVYTGEVLRFEAKMANGLVEDEMRVLVIAYYPHDDEAGDATAHATSGSMR